MTGALVGTLLFEPSVRGRRRLNGRVQQVEKQHALIQIDQIFGKYIVV